jgi:ankyrin repeat protein
MKMKRINGWNGVVVAGLVAVAAVVTKAEDVVQERFRKAMVAEEADQDLAAAVRGYESVLEGAETPLRLAATALYRLGECHRKLGQTNEASAAFERLAREFVGQTNLVRLARQNLAALGWREPSAPTERGAGAAPSSANPAVQKAQADLAEAARIERVLEMAKKSDLGSSAVLEAGLSSPELAQMKKRIVDLKFQLQDLRRQPTDKEGAERLHLQIRDSENDYRYGLERLGEQKRIEAEVLRRGAQAQLEALGASAPVAAATRDPEDLEIERLQALEKEAPDLLRRGTPNGISPIEEAVAKGRARVVEYLLGKGVPVSGAGGSATLLELAVANGRLNLVDLLLRRGADVNAKGSMGSTPLHSAIANRFPAIVQRLLEAKPDLEVVSGALPGLSSSTPLGLAVQVRDEGLVKKLLEMGAKPKGLLRLAVQTGDTTFPRVLIQAGLDAKTDPDVYDALIAALPGPDPKAMLQVLVDAGVDLNRTRGDQPPALVRAIMSNHASDLVPLVLGMGADPNRVSSGRTPLGIAFQTAKSDVVRALLEKGADPGQRTLSEASSIVSRAYLASRKVESLDILRMVVEKGGNVDEFTQVPVPDAPSRFSHASGFRTLDLAAALGDLEAVQWLLAHGASATLRNPVGWTTLQWLKWEAGLPPVQAAVKKALIDAGMPDPEDPKAGGRVGVYRLGLGRSLEAMGSIDWKRGEILWLSAVVAQRFQGQAVDRQAIEVNRGGPGSSSIQRVDLRNVTKPGDPGDLQLLDLDKVQVPEVQRRAI